MIIGGDALGRVAADRKEKYMIKVQDWIATIPDEDKHIAYVGEDKVEQRVFLLCGEGWQDYRNWSFHLDMAFDPESITNRDTRQVVQTTRNRTENTEEAGKIVDEVTTKETYTVCDEEMANYSLTDIASLDKEETEDGLRLTWQVLRQHTLLPGKLRATLRAQGDDGNYIKKSAMMVFEVDAAINAAPAARPARSEFEEMEQRMDNLLQDARWSCEDANHFAVEAEQSYNATVEAAQQAEADAQTAQTAQAAANQSALDAEQSYNATVEAAQQAEADAQTAKTAQAAANQSALDAANAEQNATRSMENCAAYQEQCAEYVEQCREVRRINVRDYGAVGDGTTDDRQAILDAFEAAKAMLPCEVYFPAGTYGISNGMYITMPFGSGGLRVCGAGRDITTIKYLDSFPKQGQNWYAFRLWFGNESDGNGNFVPIEPATEDDWMHDISFTGLTVYDPDPCAKVLHPAKTGGTAKEETHGIDIMYCKRVTVTECKFITCGDECINLDACHDVIVTNNYLVGCPGAGEGGGAIAICSGCDGVVVAGNVINGSAPDEVLADGTVIEKHSTGIEIEGMAGIVRNVLIANNVVLNVQGTGIGMYAGSEGCGVYNATITDNLIVGCNNGIDGSGDFPKEDITISGNHIADCRRLHLDNKGNPANGHGIYLYGGGFANLAVRDNAVMDIDGKGVYLSCNGKDAVVEGNTTKNVGEQAVYVSGGAYIRNCIISNTGVGNVTSNAAIEGYTGAEIRVYGCRLSGVRQPKAIAHAAEIENTYIEMVDADGNRVTDGNTVQSNYLTRLVNCQLDGYVDIKKDNAIVQGVTLNCSQQYQPAIKVSANGVIVTGCQINHTKGVECIKENTGKNHNLFANNVVNSGITTVGAQSVAVNNIDTRVTA